MLKRCEYCNKFYDAIKSNQRFCQTKCALLARRAKKVNYDPKTCAHCGAVFKPGRSTQIFCSVACHDAAHNSKQAHETECPTCGKQFERTTKRKSYCSEDCYRIAKALRDDGRERKGAYNSAARSRQALREKHTRQAAKGPKK